METVVFFLEFFIAVISFTNAKLPEEDLTVPDTIKYWGYPAEIHEAKTDDGYYLTLHRIPHGRKNSLNFTGTENIQRPVIFLQHGLLCSSSNWVANFPDDSLAFMLADAGFDVWMGNARGNTYSKKHETLSVHSTQFWDFSFEEMAKHDLPSMIGFVLRSTRQQKLYYVGHSQGTMMIFAGLSENEELQERIKIVFALAPITRLKNIYSPIKLFAPFETEFKLVLEALGINQFLPSSKILKSIAQRLCPIDMNLCANIMYMVAGYDKKDLNVTRIPVYYSHTPAGTSVKNMFHFAQLIRSQVFQKYDYGWIRNFFRYNWFYPPIYHFETIKTPMVLISGSKDWLAAPSDVLWTAKQLPNLEKFKKIKGYNHLDFIWGMSAKKKVYNQIIELIV